MKAQVPVRTVDRRRQIVDAAATVLARQGFANTSMKEIAVEVGVAPGLLHYYFSSKEDLLLEVAQSFFRQLREDQLAALAGIDDPLERAARAMDNAAEKCAASPDFARLLLDLYALALTNDRIRDSVRQMFAESLALVVSVTKQVEEGLPAGIPIDLEGMALSVMASIDGVAILSAVQGSDPAPAYRALKAMILSFVMMAYVYAGTPPPLERYAELLALTPPA